MRFSFVPIFYFIIVCIAISLSLIYFWYKNIFRFSFFHLFVFLLLHCILYYSIFTRTNSTYEDTHEWPFCFFNSVYQEKDEQTNHIYVIRGENCRHTDIDGTDEDMYNDEIYFGSDGYDEEDYDDYGSDEVGWLDDDDDHDDKNEKFNGIDNKDKKLNDIDDDDASDEDLANRIEMFIAKVVAGWKEELVRDKEQHSYCSVETGLFFI